MTAPGDVEAAARVLRPLGERVVPDGPVGPLTTYRVGGAAALLVTVSAEEELATVAEAVAVSGLPVLVVGRGSNLLVSDRGFPGIAVLLDPPSFSQLEVLEGDAGDPATRTVRSGAALPLPALARQTVEAGLTGMEWAVGVPGSVGGGVRMNAGGHGSDIAHHLVRCRMCDLDSGGAPADFTAPEMDFGYRHSAVTPHRVVVTADFRLTPGYPAAGRETIRQIVRWRREHQPGGQNAGSVFTNPPGTSAGWLIDTAGLKGRRWRSAEVSPKHANFVQADQGGSADDVYHLLGLVREEVLRRHGVELHPEVRMVGFDDPPPSGPGSSSTRGLGQ